ncbi:hypothetical protein ACFOYW_04760 [Gryllotalpicola reticulitermitis]|uniref:Uncharacterized protein n=1 Tax=Gryllotalpicola reticulitermitis TaxID=1184153 RepID=A0ABV8Q5B8_9MICO
MSRRLSAQFRRWARWYPASWRADSGAAMLGTYLDVAEEEGRDRLTVPEKAALVTGGLAARLDTVIPSRVREAVALIMVPLLGVYGLVVGLVFEWAPWAATARSNWLAPVAGRAGQEVLSFGPFLSPTIIVAGLCVLAWLASLAGPEWLYRGALGATVVVGLVLAVTAHLGHVEIGGWEGLHVDFGGFTYLRALPVLFPAVLALLALPGARPRPARVLIGAVLWAASLYPAAKLSGGWSIHDFLSGAAPVTDSLFFLVVVGSNVAWGAAVLGLFAGLVLTFARRRGLAAVIVLATLPWAVYAPGPIPWRDDALALGPLVLGYGAAIGVAIVGSSRRWKAPASARSDEAVGP